MELEKTKLTKMKMKKLKKLKKLKMELEKPAEERLRPLLLALLALVLAHRTVHIEQAM